MKQYIEKEKNFVSIIVNGDDRYEKEVGVFLKKLDKYFDEKFETYEFVIINNYCNNLNKKNIVQISEKLKTIITIVNLPWKHNVENAMKAGLDIAIGDFVFEFDDPLLDFDFTILNDLYHKCLEGYDIVSATPNQNVAFSSRIFYKIFNSASYKNIELTTENFRIVSRRALNRILSDTGNFKYRKAAYHYSGFETKTIKYNPKIKKKAHSLKDRLSLAGNILTYNSNIGTKLCVSISMIFLMVSILAVIFTILSFIFVTNIQKGWTTTMLFISVSFTGLFFILTIISKYIETLIREIQNKPSYIYQSIDKISKSN